MTRTARRPRRQRTPTVAERIRAALASLTPAERRVARTLLGDYPLLGLQPVAVLADRAGSSAPTVLRLFGKLGFHGYPDVQRAITDELAARLSSPLSLYPTGRSGVDVFGHMRDSLADSVRRSMELLDAADVAAVVALFADSRRPLWTVGGRFSRMLADFLAMHLTMLRPGVRRVPPSAGDRAMALLDMDRRSVVVAFDYRRYQRSTIEFATAACDCGATLVLFTDHLLSPLAARAAVVVQTTIEGPTPFDVFTPATAVVESLIAVVVDTMGDAPRERIARFDDIDATLVTDPEHRPPPEPGTQR